MSEKDSPEARPWSPSPEVRDDVVTVRSAAALHDLLDAEGPPPGSGDPIPPLWHWLAFLPDAPQRQLGPDGHPVKSDFLPPTALPHRMYARGRVDMSEAPVARIDMPLHRRSLVTSVTQKSGRFDKMVFVEVTHELSTAGLLFCTDIQDLVYLGDETSRSPTNFETQTHRLGDDGSWIWRRELAIDETLLFRFSALTYNAHRIHYDQKYATNIEGYPDLVVHAPLQALALAELCRFHLGERRILSFGFRAKRPAFNGAPLQLRGRLIDEQHVELEAIDSEGLTTMSAVAILASK